MKEIHDQLGKWSMLKHAITYYKPYKWLFTIDLVCAVLVAVLEMVFPAVVTHIVDELLPIGDWPRILKASLFLLFIYLVNTGLYMVIQYWGEKLGMYIENDMRIRLFAHLQKLSFKYYDNQRIGRLISKVANDLHTIGTVAHYAPEQFIVATAMLMITLVIMARVNWLLSAVIICMIVLILYVNIVFTKKMVHTMRSLFISAGDISTRLEQSLSGIRVIQAYANEAYQMRLFTKEAKAYCRKQEAGYKQIALCNSITYYLTRLLPVISMIGGGWLVVNQKMSNGQFFSFILLTNLVLKPIDMLSNFAARYPKGIAGFRSYMQLMNNEPDIKDEPGAKPVENVRGDICFEKVSFSYDEEAEILKNIDLTIGQGETIAFVGHSGTGKSTLCSLIPRFYDRDKGTITLDGRDIQSITLHSLRKQIGVVQQDVFLFSGTIEENLRFGREDATEEELWKAVEKANLRSFVEAQPLGMATVIGERGVKMSGGQKQRLSIARMFLKNPPILILDEATSSLDTENEAAIHQSLKSLAEGRTTLIIAHRFSTIKDADRIIVLDKGGIVDSGTHSELMDRKGIYRLLYGLQNNNRSA